MPYDVTPIFGMHKPIPATTARELAAVLGQMVDTTEAALARGGIAPPAAQDLAALAGRVTSLETKTTVLRATALAMNGSALTAVPWSSRTTRSTAAGWAAGQPTRLVAPAAGEYRLGVTLPWALSPNAGGLETSARLNGSTEHGMDARASQPWYPATVSAVLSGLELAAGGYVEVLVRHNTDPSRSILAGARATLERVR